MRIISLLLAALVSATASDAMAQSATRFGQFDLLQSEDICVLTSEFEFDGRSDVSFRLISDGGGAFIVLGSSDWSALPEGASLDYLFFNASLEALDGYTVTPNATKLDGYLPGFAIKVSDEFLVGFSRGNSMLVRFGENTITHINLRGSSAATTAMNLCRRRVAARNDERARAEQKWDYISKDPFAPPPSNESSEVVGQQISWARQPRVIQRDFPQRALDRGVSGAAEVDCKVASSGRLEECNVVSETPEGYGFGAAAIRVVGRAQISPRYTEPRARVPISFDIADVS